MRAAGPSIRASVSALKGQPERSAPLLALFFFAAVLEALGLLFLVPLAAVLGIPVGGEGFGIGRVAMVFEPVSARLGASLSLLVVLMLIGGTVSLVAYVRYRARILCGLIVENHERRVRASLHRSIARADWVFHANLRQAEMVRTVTEGVAQIGDSLRGTLQVLSRALIVVACLSAAAWLSPLGVGLAGVVGGILWAVLRGPAKALHAAYGTHHAWAGRAARRVTALVGEVGSAKVHADEDGQCDRFEDAGDGLSRVRMDRESAEAKLALLFTVGGVAALALLIWAGTELVGIALVLLVATALVRVIPAAVDLRPLIQGLADAVPDHRDVDALLARATAASEPATWHGSPLVPLVHGVLMERVDFHPSGEDGIVAVEEISLDIPALKVTALVGPRHAGKATIVQLLTGLLVPRSGSVAVDGRPLEGPTRRGWRKAIGYVGRDATVLDATVRENVVGGDDERWDDALWNVLRIAGLGHFVASLPEGLDTLLDGDPERLPEGIARRFALARALFRRPHLLILEETGGGGHHDPLIPAAVRSLRGRVTILIVAERIASTREADGVHVVEAGRVVESGSWNELLEGGGRFPLLLEVERGRYGAPPHEAAVRKEGVVTRLLTEEGKAEYL